MIIELFLSQVVRDMQAAIHEAAIEYIKQTCQILLSKMINLRIKELNNNKCIYFSINGVKSIGAKPI
ncbi:hypothetical protein LguiA_022631 [Lonicera macranthoides]